MYTRVHPHVCGMCMARVHRYSSDLQMFGKCIGRSLDAFKLLAVFLSFVRPPSLTRMHARPSTDPRVRPEYTVHR